MESEKIRVLVISYLPWRNDVSTGNTLTNLFEGLQKKMEFANIYFKGGKPQNNVAEFHFYISEKQLAKSIITKRPVGEEIIAKCNEHETISPDNGIYNKARQMRWESMLLVQDLIGICGKWKSEELNKFINKFEPDIVFGPLGRVPAANILMQYVHEKYSIPIVPYAWDDHYSLKKRALSPFFWIKTFIERKYIKRCVDASEFLYTITVPMQQEYEQYFNKKCKVLYKGYDFLGEAPVKDSVSFPVKIVYMGNIGSGRWQGLAKVAKAISNINHNEKKAELFIYTMSPKSKAIKRALTIRGTSKLMAPVPYEEVLPTMNSADILLYVEPTSEKERLFFRLSFSTKIVDYLYNARCIFAVGGMTASIDYMKNNAAAIVETKDDKIETTLYNLISDHHKILQYGKNAWECGVRNHQRSVIQDNLYDTFVNITKK